MKKIIKQSDVRRRDPSFKEAIAAAAKAEADHAKNDPVEGEIVIGDIVDGELVEEAGPIRSEIRRLLHG